MAKVGGFLKHYYLALTMTAFIMAAAVILSGPSALLPVTALALIEITFSFENAVLNSQVLSTMSKIWRTIFLTVGIAIAVFGVRLIMPLLMVSGTTGTTLGHVFDLALNKPEIYSAELKHAYPVIAAFGGVFLLMIGLRFFGEKKEVLWWNRVESGLADFNQPWRVAFTGAIAAILLIHFFLSKGNGKIVIAAILGAITFMIIKFLSELLMARQKQNVTMHQGNNHSSGFVQFLYLEMLDASFSFDGVIAAFAITKDVLLIATGLGIGAIYVRSITLHLLKEGTLSHFRYLIHGAHYAILSLSILLILSIGIHIPELITGFLGLIIIGLSIHSSWRHNKSLMAG